MDDSFIKTDEARTICNLVFIKYVDYESVEWRCQVDQIRLDCVFAVAIDKWGCHAIVYNSIDSLTSNFDPDINVAVKLCLYSLSNIKESIEQILYLAE
jgi:hypothetical protein